MFCPAAATKTQVYEAMAACQAVQSVLLGLALATDDVAVFQACMDEVLDLQMHIDVGTSLWSDVDRARRARGVRRGANGDDLRIAAANGYVPWFDAVLEGGRASEGAYLEFLSVTYPMFDHICSLAAMTPFGQQLDPLAPGRGRTRILNHRQLCAFGLHEMTSHDSSATMAHLFGTHPGTATRTGREAQILLNEAYHIWDKAQVTLSSKLAQDMLSHLIREHNDGEVRLSDEVFAKNKNIWSIDGYPVRTVRSGNRFVQSAFYQAKAGYHCTLQVELFSPTGCCDSYVVNIPGRFSELEEAKPILRALRDPTLTIPFAKSYGDSLFRLTEFQDVLSAVPKAVEKIANWDSGNLDVTKAKAKNVMKHRFSAGTNRFTAIFLPEMHATC